MADTPGLSPVYPSWQEALREIATRLNAMLLGKINAVGTVTLTANATTTTVMDTRVTPSSHVSLTPLTANAAADFPSCYISARTSGTSFVITHPNDADTDKNFTYAVIG